MTNNNLNYFDNASTTKVDDRVVAEMLPYFTEYFGNASSNHSYGKKAKDAIENARIQVSNIINCDSNQITFTSGATESINLGIKGYVEANPEKGNHIITVKTEHKAVLATCEYLETKGVPVIGFWRTTPDRIKYPSEEAEYMRRVAHTVGMKRRHFKKKYPILYRDLINYLRKRLNKYNS